MLVAHGTLRTMIPDVAICVVDHSISLEEGRLAVNSLLMWTGGVSMQMAAAVLYDMERSVRSKGTFIM